MLSFIMLVIKDCIMVRQQMILLKEKDLNIPADFVVDGRLTVEVGGAWPSLARVRHKQW